MDLDGYIACICEGESERAILDLLLDADKLLFNREILLDNDLIRCRSAKKFEERYLRKSFDKKITTVRVLDSRNEKFNLSKAYQGKIKVINIITAPEIEMLIIFNEKKYESFKKSEKKPSDYCKQDLKIKNIKNYDFIKNYFSNIPSLISSIKEYKRISNVKKNEHTLCNIIKCKYLKD